MMNIKKTLVKMLCRVYRGKSLNRSKCGSVHLEFCTGVFPGRLVICLRKKTGILSRHEVVAILETMMSLNQRYDQIKTILFNEKLQKYQHQGMHVLIFAWAYGYTRLT